MCCCSGEPSGWASLPFDLLHMVKLFLVKNRGAVFATAATLRLVNKHWHQWANDETLVLRLTHMQGLTHGARCSADEMLETISVKFPNLEVLHLGKSFRFSDHGLHCLTRLQHIQEVLLQGFDITADLGWLEGLKALKTLHLSRCGKTKQEGLNVLSRLSSVESLELAQLELCPQNHPFSDEAAQCLRELPHLSALTLIRWYPITEAGLTNLSNISALELNHCDCFTLTSKGLGALTRLTWLCLSHCQGITDERLRLLSTLTSLKSLSIVAPHGGWLTGQGLVNMSSLTHLCLIECSTLSVVGMQCLGRLSSLTSLDLCCSSVTDEGLRCLASLTSLTLLDLGANPFGSCLTDEGLKWLVLLESLTKLNVSGCGKLTCKGIKTLQSAGGLSIRGLRRLGLTT